MIALLVASQLLAAPAVLSTHVSGSIEASLVRVAPADGQALAAQVARLVAWRGDIVRNVQPNDTLRLVYEPSEVPQLLALAYLGSEIALQAYAFAGDDGVERYYDETGTLIEPAIENPPVPGYIQITEVVQRGRGKRRHHGVDLKAPEGAPVLLPRAGRVSRVNWSTRTNGQCVEVVFGDGTLARFLHLSEIDPAVAHGQRLEAGARIGAVGSTGRSSAPHLHYDLRSPAGEILDPLIVHGTRTLSLPAASRPAFTEKRARLARLLGVEPGASPASSEAATR